MKVVAKTVGKQMQQNQAINTIIVKDLFIERGTRLVCGKGDFNQKMLSKWVNVNVDWVNVFSQVENKKDYNSVSMALFLSRWE